MSSVRGRDIGFQQKVGSDFFRNGEEREDNERHNWIMISAIIKMRVMLPDRQRDSHENTDDGCALSLTMSVSETGPKLVT